MALSSSSLFHYTRHFDTLKRIVATGFRYSHCAEELPSQGYGQYVDRYLHESRCVCFCDLPLSQSTAHQVQYGKYAIAMSKRWGIEVGITPIRYLHEHSPDIRAYFFRRLDELFHGLSRLDGGVFEFYSGYLKEAGFENPPSYDLDVRNGSKGLQEVLKLIEDDYGEIINAYSRLVGLSRIYEGPWVDRETSELVRRRFYEEREWRALSLRANEENLRFQFSDINYILVNDLHEQQQMVDFLQSGQLKELAVPDSPSAMWSKVLVATTIMADL